MDDFFGEPLFQPTGTDWIDHAFTAAILDEMDQEDQGTDTEGEDTGEEDNGISIEINVSFGGDDGADGTPDLADALAAADDAIQSAETDIATLIAALEDAKFTLELEEPEDICSEAWEAWNERMEKLGNIIDDLEIASSSAS